MKRMKVMTTLTLILVLASLVACQPALERQEAPDSSTMPKQLQDDYEHLAK